MTDQGITTTPPRAPSAVDVLRNDLQRMESQFAAALPAHIPVERFMRVVMTAIQNNPDLLKCTRQSLFNACVRAAQDGLLPDGREGAIVPYENNSGGVSAQWLPMIAGLRKKARNSGELSDWFAEVVHEGDEFDYQKGDNPFIFHRPAKTGGRTRPVTHAYSIAIYKDGSKSREVMNVDEIEEIRRNFSKSRKGPWNNPVLYPEMCRKTVARLHSKQLPMSTDLDTLLRRDDDLYQFGEARERASETARPPTATALDYFAGGLVPPVATVAAAGDPPASPVPTSPPGAPPSPAPPDPPPPDLPAADPAAPPAGTPPAARASGPAVPKDGDQYRAMFDATVAHATETGQAAQLHSWFTSDAQRRLRNACGVLSDERGEMQAIVDSLTAHPPAGPA